MRRALCTLAALAFAAGCGASEPASEGPESGGSFDEERAFADLVAQVEIGPRPAGSPGAEETARLIESRLREAGLGPVTIQRPWRNVTATLPGEEPGVIVVGAHYDTKDDIAGFVGANDGASGVAVVLELARSLPRPSPGPAIQLVLFDAEEARGDRPFEVDGARGSRQFVEYARGAEQGAPPLSEIRAMVLFDLVGDCDLQIPREAYSDPELYELFAGAAASGSSSGSPAPFQGETSGILDDHIPFREAGVPAINLIDFTFGDGPSPGSHWHTPEDTLDKVCPESLDAVGEPALAAIPTIR